MASLKSRHAAHFADYLKKGVELGRLDSSLLTFDVAKLANAMHVERDTRFTYMGLQTVYDRYLIHNKGTRLEAPQYFWMRVAMDSPCWKRRTRRTSAPLNSTNCFPPNVSQAPRQRCSTPARCTRSFRRAT